MSTKSDQWTIAETVEAISSNELILPAIQREFVWEPKAICEFFQSILVSLPIGACIFWEHKSANLRNYHFYNFIEEFSTERNSPLNQGIKVTSAELASTKYAVVDGQQRLTSLFLGLKGKLTDSENSSQYLHMNVSEKPAINDDSDTDFAGTTTRFAFREEDRPDHFSKKLAKHTGTVNYWFKVSDILLLTTPAKIRSHLTKNMNFSIGSSEFNCAKSLIHDLRFEVTQNNRILIEQLEAPDVDTVLSAFIRVNLKGKRLDDFTLMSSVLANQMKEREGRKLIRDLVRNFNRYGLGTQKQLVIKAALAISGKDIDINFNQFTVRTSRKIEAEWEIIERSLLLTGKLLHQLGFSDRRILLVKDAVILPILTFIVEGGHCNPNINIEDERLLVTGTYSGTRTSIQKFVSTCQIIPTLDSNRGYWGRQNAKKINRLVKTIRELAKPNSRKFPVDELLNRLGKIEPFAVLEREVHDKIIRATYNDRDIRPLVALLFPSETQGNMHIDHIFSKDQLEELHGGDTWVDYLSNLQLLRGPENVEKGAKDPKDWLSQITDPSTRQKLVKRNLLSGLEHIDETDLNSLKDWWNERDQKLIRKLLKIIPITSAIPVSEPK